MTRAALRTALKAAFGPARRVAPLAADASVRSFFRLVEPSGLTRVVLVDEPGGTRALDRLAAAQDLFARIGVRVPAIVRRDDALAALLVEDLGDTLLSDALPAATPREREAWYAAAGAMAARIAVAATPFVREGHVLASPRLAAERLRIELALWTVHDVAFRRDIRDLGLLADLSRACDRLAADLAAEPAQFAHRDFHARNLMVLPGGALAAVDFQDALLAPPGYDLASLIRDPYVEPDDALCGAAARAYMAGAGLPADPREDPRFNLVALQRDLKAIGTYAFQARVRRRKQFLAHIPAAERLAVLSTHEMPRADARRWLDLLQRIGFPAA